MKACDLSTTAGLKNKRLWEGVANVASVVRDCRTEIRFAVYRAGLVRRRHSIISEVAALFSRSC